MGMELPKDTFGASKGDLPEETKDLEETKISSQGDISEQLLS